MSSIEEREITGEPNVGSLEEDPSAEVRSADHAERRPKLGLRDRIPKLGLTEYWYPAVADKAVPRKKPLRRRILGQDIVFWRNAEQRVVALTNWCPHRNASLAQGKCFYEGTITCAY